MSLGSAANRLNARVTPQIYRQRTAARRSAICR